MISHGETSPAKAKAKARPSRRRKKGAAAASPPENHKTASMGPVVVEAGIRSKSSLRHLEEGTGPLMHEIGRIVHAIHAAVPEPVPIVIVYQKKRSSGSRSASPFGLFF
jgi:hypothetical protein